MRSLAKNGTTFLLTASTLPVIHTTIPTVSATPPAIETSNASLGQVVTTRSVEALPLNVRSSMALVGLTPGVVFASAAGYDSSASAAGRNFMKSDFNVGGGVAYFQEILVDGAPNTTPDYGYGIIDPPVDSLQGV